MRILFVAVSLLVAGAALADPPGCLNPDEELLGQLINTYRADNGQPAIPFSLSLTLVGQWHVEDFVYAIEVSGEYGADPQCNLHSWYPLPGAPFSTCCYTADHAQAACMWNKPAEITGGAYPATGFEIAVAGAPDVATALNAWQNSPAHNDVLLNQGIWASYVWNAMGMGVVRSDDYRFYFVWFSTLVDPDGEASACATPVPADPASVLEFRGAYPNPFNPSVTVAYSLSEPAGVRLSIHDVAGRVVRRLPAAVRGAGEHEFVWDGTDDGGRALPSGIYLIRLQAGESAWTERVALIK